MKQQHAALMTLGMMLMLACRGITAEERGRGPFEKHGGNRGAARKFTSKFAARSARFCKFLPVSKFQELSCTRHDIP
jgi:hypothetical protein